MSRVSLLVLILSLALFSPPAAPAAPVDDLIAKIKAVAADETGAADAADSWKKLVALGPDAMPSILAGIDDNNAVASNWLRIAVAAIGEQAQAANRPLPNEKLESFIADKTKSPAARRLAYEWLAKVDKTTPARLLPGMLQDPSAELRRDAVAVLIQKAQGRLEKKDEAGAKTAFQKALTGACDEDQVKIIADNLAKLGVKVDLAAHYGFIRHWHLLTAFDNTDGVGFAKVYPPETAIDLKAVYKGKGEDEARWTAFTSADPYGKVDLNVIIGKKKGVVAYAYAVIDAPEERTVQLRAGSFNAIKMFVNGKPVFGRNEYHHGMHLDQHNATITLQKGRNELLLKICQNDQADPWAQSWVFQARLCDAAGAAVAVKEVEVKP